jgi:hypothetical protein
LLQPSCAEEDSSSLGNTYQVWCTKSKKNKGLGISLDFDRGSGRLPGQVLTFKPTFGAKKGKSKLFINVIIQMVDTFELEGVWYLLDMKENFWCKLGLVKRNLDKDLTSATFRKVLFCISQIMGGWVAF